jgi:hypothetical protein
MQLDQLLHQRQPDAGAFEGAALRAFDAMEAVEQARQLVQRDAGARVGHDHLRMRAVGGAFTVTRMCRGR